MQWNARLLVILVSLILTSACATVAPEPVRVEVPATRDQQRVAQAAAPATPELKQRIAIARFTNETNYGRTLFRDSDLNPLGKQVADMLATRLVQSNKFIVFERPELSAVELEAMRGDAMSIPGVNTLIIGSVTEFGRATTGRTGFFSSTKQQTARARVEARLVDVRTGRVFFATSGTGTASTESGSTAGYGSRAEYDATLNDRAIAAAISDLMGNMMTELEARRWRTDILQVEAGSVFIAGGRSLGLVAGDRLEVVRRGSQVQSRTTGSLIELPGEKVGELEITGFFGESELDEGSVARIVSGSLSSSDMESYDVFIIR